MGEKGAEREFEMSETFEGASSAEASGGAEAARVLAGGGFMGELMRSFDWSQTPLGPIERWPQSLRTTVSTCLNSRFPILIWWGPEHVKLYNDPYAMILGVKHPWALGRPGREVWPEIWDVIGPMLEAVYSRGEATWSENTLLPLERYGFAEECYFTFSYSPIRDERGAVSGIFTAVTETTAQVLSERRLRALHRLSEETAGSPSLAATLDGVVRALAESPADLPFSALYSFDGDEARLAGANGLATPVPSMVTREHLIGLTRRGLMPLGDAAGSLELAPLGTPPPERAIALPIQHAGSDEPHGVLLCGLSPMLAFDARYEHFLSLLTQQIGAAIDTARAGEDARRRAEALAEIDRAKTAFFSNVSHEFRTPLTLMLGPMEDALAGGALAGDDLATAYRNALRLQKLVNALLDFSRIEAGRMHARFAPTELARLTADLAGVFESAMARAGLRYLVRCDDVGELFVDRDLYEKIVLNLLSNALKFTFDGEVEVTLRDAGDAVELQVRDTGVGVAAAEVPRLFERFHRVAGAPARTHEGSGIGLALVSDLVKLHGGTIEAESELGVGTRFTVRLRKGRAHLPDDKLAAPGEPAATQTARAFVEEALRWLPEMGKAGASEPPPADAAARASGATVIVADDNADMRDYLRRVLQPHCDVVAVSDGVAALAAVRKRRPDLVLTDVMMPGLDGFGLVAALRADARTRSIPVVMLSARAGEEARIEGLQAGADDYLVKPFSARELIARVRTHLELARLRRAIELQNETLNDLFAQAPAAVCVMEGPEHVYRLANPPYREVVGDRELLGKSIREALPELAGQGIYELLDRAFATGERVVRPEILIKLRRNGRLEDCYFTLIYQPYRDADGEVAGVMAFGFDLTEQVRARQRAEALTREVQASEAAAAAASRAKDEFLAMLGHELRNPLAPILTALHLMRLRDGDHHATERAIIERQAQHLVRLVDDLLDVSRITRAKIELKRRRVEVAQVVARAIEMASPLLEQRRHNLAVDVPSRGLVVDGDPARLGQVVANLLTNAAKYTAQGGQVSIAARQSGGQIAVSVRDTGIGIAPEMLPRVFDMFVQERQALDRAEGGLGLGLTIVKSLVALHGGSVEVRSEGRNRGAEFIVKLPAVNADEAGLDEAADDPAGATAAGGVRILVVDDNEDAAELLASALELTGYRTLVVHDGPAALAAVGEFEPDIAMLDIGLPVMDGYELARRLRAEPRWSALRLVAVTGYGQQSDRQRSEDAGFDAHLVKPIDIARLPALIDELTRAARAR